MARVRGWQRMCGVVLFCALMATRASAQDVLTTLVNFGGKNGSDPGSLIQGSDGNFYGTTDIGGTNCLNRNGIGCGTVFKTTPDGKLTTLHSFCALAQCADGKNPAGSLLQATNGNFYGTTSTGGSGGPDGCGTVFEMSGAGKLTTLHSFDSTDGCGAGGLLQAANGNFYGTTPWGGVNGGGTVFEISAAGKFTTLYSFCSLPSCTDGSLPVGRLVQATDGNFYGTTMIGGANDNAEFCSNGCGTVFRLTQKGALITLYSFCSLNNCADGYNPEAPLVQATDGNFYGTTYYGGVANAYAGTVFEITSGGNLTTLYSFCTVTNCFDGESPLGPLVQATDGNFYGVTESGGTSSTRGGSIFEITPAGTLTTLYSFCTLPNCADGIFPEAGLLQATNGNFYGTTYQDGSGGDGTVFSLSTGLGPFVSFIRNPAKVGQQFGILGYGLNGTSGVSLNGVAASFKVEFDTLLVATVPTGATTGYVTVNTPGGTLTSNVPFRVLP